MFSLRVGERVHSKNAENGLQMQPARSGLLSAVLTGVLGGASLSLCLELTT